MDPEAEVNWLFRRGYDIKPGTSLSILENIQSGSGWNITNPHFIYFMLVRDHCLWSGPQSSIIFANNCHPLPEEDFGPYLCHQIPVFAGHFPTLAGQIPYLSVNHVASIPTNVGYTPNAASFPSFLSCLWLSGHWDLAHSLQKSHQGKSWLLLSQATLEKEGWGKFHINHQFCGPQIELACQSSWCHDSWFGSQWYGSACPTLVLVACWVMVPCT